MDLYLVRHGEAAGGSPDASRPLNSSGRAAVERVAGLTVESGLAVEEIRHSGYLRAMQTAEMLAAALEPARGVDSMPGLRPMDEADLIAYSLSELRSATMLVGHLPFMARLAGLLVTGDAERAPVNFPTATLAHLKGHEGTWEVVRVIRP